MISYISRFYLCWKAQGESGWVVKAKGPKRHQTRHLGPRCVLFSFLCIFYNLSACLALFSYKTPSTHSSATTTPPSLETQVGGVFFLSSAPPSLETWDGGAFSSSKWQTCCLVERRAQREQQWSTSMSVPVNPNRTAHGPGNGSYDDGGGSFMFNNDLQ